jgi:glutathione synthase/RimK-type ligase-like ATP-grasp enzyme
MILIITAPNDVHADDVEKRLRARGADVFRFDPATIPQRARVTVGYRGMAKRVRLTLDGQATELTDATCAWLRRPGAPVTHHDITDRMFREYAHRECQQLAHDIWNALEVAWLPGPLWAIRRADSKHLQLQLAAALGFEIPATLITTSTDEFLAFHREHDGEIIDKLPSVVFPLDRKGPVFRFTNRVTTRDVGYLHRLRYAPMLFQPNVRKEVELRVTVVGTRVFAAEIHSQATAHTMQDWRRYDHAHTPYRVHELPAKVAACCVDLVARLGLRYGAIDLILTPRGQYVFLEINPNGQWLWAERKTGLPISEAICDLLEADASAARERAAC